VGETYNAPAMISLKTLCKIRPAILIMVLLSLTNLSIYWPVQNFEFINLDDHAYVLANPMVQEGLTLSGLKWAFTTFDYNTANWHPLTWLSLMLDWQLYGMSSGGYHWTNLLIHIANTLLLFVALRKMTKALWRSAFVAVLFAVHPLHVESVAWVSERKDVLCALFWFLAIGMYVRYAENPRYKSYLLTLFFFVLGLLAKPMAVTLPFILLLLDYWPLRRFTQQTNIIQESTVYSVTASPYLRQPTFYLILEKGPFLILSLLSSAITFLAQESGEAVQSITNVPLSLRVANAFVAYLAYIAKMVWPHDLAVFYPLPNAWPIWHVFLAFTLIIAMTAMVMLLLKKHPYLFTGWFWYVGSLVPVIGLVQVGTQSMADRYTYIPLTGLFIIIAWGTVDIINFRRSLRYLLPLLLSFSIGAFITVSRLQVQHWRNSLTLFHHTLAVTRENYFAHNGMGVALRSLGDIRGAEMHFKETLRIRPKFAEAHANLGGIYFLRKEFDVASDHFLVALRISPRYLDARFNLAQVYLIQEKYTDAIAVYRYILMEKPDHAEAHNYLGVALICQMDVEGAIGEFKTALRIHPQYAKARINLSNALAMQERFKVDPQ